MEILFPQLLSMLNALWWPFVRILAAFSAAPMLGDAMVPLPLRALLSLVMTIAVLPAAQSMSGIDPWSMAGILATIEQAAIGLTLGLAFHLTMAAISLLGYLVSSQMGLAMAAMNDPVNGSSSDVVSVLLSVLVMLIFFSIDGHLVFAGVIGASFQMWPVGQGLNLAAMHSLALNVAWVFSAALLMALPIIFSTLVVQLGFGFLNRVAPSLNLFSLGFSVVTLFGVFMLAHMLRAVPGHFVDMSGQVLDMLQRDLRMVTRG